MKMKRIIAILLFSASLLSMAACSQNNSQGNSAPAAQSTVAKEAGTDQSTGSPAKVSRSEETKQNDTEAEKTKNEPEEKDASLESSEQKSGIYGQAEQRAEDFMKQYPEKAYKDESGNPDNDLTKRVLIRTLLDHPQYSDENLSDILAEPWYANYDTDEIYAQDLSVADQAAVIVEKYAETANTTNIGQVTVILNKLKSQYPEQYPTLSYRQLAELVNLRSFVAWSFPYQEAMIVGLVDGTEPKITLEEVKELIAKYDALYIQQEQLANDDAQYVHPPYTPSKVAEALSQKQLPTESGGSGMEFCSYDLADGGTLTVFIYPQRIVYRPANATSEEDDVILWSPLQTNHPT